MTTTKVPFEPEAGYYEGVEGRAKNEGIYEVRRSKNGKTWYALRMTRNALGHIVYTYVGHSVTICDRIEI